jgi:two-component system nitrogen regulation response regulator GlnG
MLLPEFLPDFVRDPVAHSASSHADLASWNSFLEKQLAQGADDVYAKWQELTDRYLLTKVIAHTGDNLSRAARVLGINRRTLRTKLRSLGMRSRDESDDSAD